MKQGFYEQLVTQALGEAIDQNRQHHLAIESFTGADGAVLLNRFFQQIFQRVFSRLATGNEEEAKERIIGLANDLIRLMSDRINDTSLLGEQLRDTGELLKAFFEREHYPYQRLEDHIKERYPVTGLSESALFTGFRQDLSMESELKKEMLSADESLWLVSFIKFEGIRLFEQVFKKMRDEDRTLRIICTVYMGATDLKAIDFLSNFSNVQLKISYNEQQDRLHAKSYLFYRKTGFHTGYIGSSNLSRTALTNGLEWNLKITQQEIPHIIDRCMKTFEAYWNDPEFVLYVKDRDRERLSKALNKGKDIGSQSILSFFDIKPFPFQQEILDRLADCRRKGLTRNLVVAATGTGKTVMAAFDFASYRKENSKARFLFVAHREEILKQAQYTFRQILRDANFGELWFSGQEAEQRSHLFVTNATLSNRIGSMGLAADFYDYIVIDEVHHSAASTYQKILNHFTPKILLGLTATPERHDGADISSIFGGTISAEIRLPEAMNRDLLCPFQYFGVPDNTDLQIVPWRNGRYDITELERVYTSEDRQVKSVLYNCEKYLLDVSEVRALGFCVSKKHAAFMSTKFSASGLKADYLVSDRQDTDPNFRNAIVQKLRQKEINYLFVVDMFNEGVDIPEVDTLLFLRPTESLTIFLQQLGRGLRKHADKSVVTVLDFVGQQRAEYSFEHKFRAMLGKTHRKIRDEIEADFPRLPLGCSIVLERTARDIILSTITKLTQGGERKMVALIRSFKESYSVALTLEHFCSLMDVDLHRVYATKRLWFELCALAGNQSIGDVELHRKLTKAMSATWISTDSPSYFTYLIRFFSESFIVPQTKVEEQWLLMFYLDVYGKLPDVVSYDELVVKLGAAFDAHIRAELAMYFKLRVKQSDVLEDDHSFSFETALVLHGRYTREQILVGLGLTRLGIIKESREGVIRNSALKLEGLFVTLDKSDGRFSPSTMYEDYFLDREHFHWQSQSQTSERSPVGQSYIHHVQTGKTMLLFVREATKDEHKLTMGFVFCGELEYERHTGSKPMSVTWRLLQRPPAMLYNEGMLGVG